MKNKLPITATIISFNEENNIKRCIESLQFCSEIIVIDSYSQDKTKEIALSLGAKVFENPFHGYGEQKNFAANKALFPWILNLDADEEITLELQNELFEIFKNSPSKLDVFQVPRLTQYCKKWIHHGGWYPNYVTRIYNKENVDWSEPRVHEFLKAKNTLNNLSIHKLKNHMHHYSFPTFLSQLQVNVKYAALGAQDLINKSGRKPSLLKVFLRPIGKFFECYILKQGFRDGKEGLFIALNASYSMFMKYGIAYFDKLEKRN